MKKIVFVSFFICIFFSSICFGKNLLHPNHFQSHFAALKPEEDDFPNIFSSIENLLRRVLHKRRIGGELGGIPNVTELSLSQKEILLDSDSTKSSLINVSSEAVDPENDVLYYFYGVSAGYIIAEKEGSKKVIWDLSGVKPGVYSIIVMVDDGCGYCGQSITKTVTVKKCPDCKNE